MMRRPQLGVNRSHIGKIVDTVGWVRAVWAARPEDTDWVTNRVGEFPPGLRFILKDIDSLNRAWLYRMDTGVVAIPAHLVDYWGK